MYAQSHGEGGGASNLHSGARRRRHRSPRALWAPSPATVETGEVKAGNHRPRPAHHPHCPADAAASATPSSKPPPARPPTYAQPGEPGPRRTGIILELKLLADVGLVGLPNAGKSTLLSVVSAAKPKIADYAFTTLVPNLGVVAYRDFKSFVMADIPGIIEGAAEGKGLGTRFLRHIERNSMLLFMISCDSPDIAAEYQILLSELQQFNPELLDKKRLLAITKSDMIDEELEAEMRAGLPADMPETVFISSLANKNLVQLKDMIWKALHA